MTGESHIAKGEVEPRESDIPRQEDILLVEDPCKGSSIWEWVFNQYRVKIDKERKEIIFEYLIFKE